MPNFLVKAGLAALIALTGFSVTAPSAAAASPELTIQVQYRDRDRGWRPDRGPRACQLGLAERKARRMGLRRSHVVRVTRRAVTVAGITRRGPDRVVFANVRGCPLIRR